jgi:Tol biopolymer transport system component
VASHDQPLSFLERGAFRAAVNLLTDEQVEFSAGQRISQYEIIAPLGAGGMGEVYLANDTKVGRRVALKLLPRYFTRDQQPVQRFKQEAQAVVALNHPNIVTIYDIGQDKDTHFIVTEFIEGETLRQRASDRGLKLSETIEVAIQVTSALVAAHEAGVVHRDIKPDNIMLRLDGYVKVLDFGLAKLLENPVTTSTDSAIATRILVKTDAGVVMGTANYMSPEQARGNDMDARTDIWSLGVVIYELAAGRLPFEGTTPTETIARIIEREPSPLARYAPELPAEFERIITKALTKDREERYQTAKDLLIDLKRLKQRLEVDSEIERVRVPDASPLSTGGQLSRKRTSPPVAGTIDANSSADYLPRSIKRHKTGLLIGAAVLAIALAALGFGLYALLGGRHGSEAGSGSLKTIPLTSFPGSKSSPAFSPDGKQIAFEWNGEKEHNRDIYVKLVGEGSPLRLTTDPHADHSPTWSPDAHYIAFVREYEEGRTLITVSAMGGAERKLFTSPGLREVDWSSDGKHLAVADGDSAGGLTDIYLVSPDTGEKKKLTQTPAQFNGDKGPKFSPDGQWVAFIRSSNYAVDDVYIAPADGGPSRRLTTDGHVVFGISWTADGREIVFSSNRGGGYGLWRISVDGGAPEPLAGVGGDAFQPAISRQAGYLAYVLHRSDTNIWRAPGPNAPGKGASPTRLISSTRAESSPNYSPDGKKIAFSSDRSGGTEIWVCDNEGQTQIQLTKFGGYAGSPSWSPDGKEIALDARPEGSGDIYIVSAEGGSPRRLTSEPSAERRPLWSKDGRWIYFVSDRTGDWQIWKMPAVGGAAMQVTKDGGNGPLLAVDQFIYYTKSSYVSPKKQNEPGVWRVPLAGGDEVRVFDQGSTDFVSMTAEGIGFFNSRSTPNPTIDFYRFATAQVTNLLSIEKSKSGGGGGILSVSPDGQWLIYVETDQIENDIMLVENFR